MKKLKTLFVNLWWLCRHDLFEVQMKPKPESDFAEFNKKLDELKKILETPI